MTWNLIKQDKAIDNFDLISKWKKDLTVDHSYFTTIKSTTSENFNELVLKSGDHYLNLTASNGFNPADQSVALKEDSEFRETIGAFPSLTYSEDSFKERLFENFGNGSKTGMIFSDGNIENYFIYKHETENLFIFVVEYSVGMFSSMIFGTMNTTSQTEEKLLVFSTNGKLTTYDNSISAKDDYRALFQYSSFFCCFFRNKIIDSGSSTLAFYSDEWLQLGTNVETEAFKSRSANYSGNSTSYLFGMSKTKFNEKHIPLPLYLYANKRDVKDTKQTILACFPDFYSICFDTIEPKEELVFGSRVVKCFPNYQKSRPTEWGDYKTGASGIGIRI